MLEKTMKQVLTKKINEWIESIDDVKIDIIVRIRENSTGIIREKPDYCLVDKDGPCLYIWEEGNYSCDCNRAAFFSGADEEFDDECGDHRFDIEIIRKDDGYILYSEFEEQL